MSCTKRLKRLPKGQRRGCEISNMLDISSCIALEIVRRVKLYNNVIYCSNL